MTTLRGGIPGAAPNNVYKRRLAWRLMLQSGNARLGKRMRKSSGIKNYITFFGSILLVEGWEEFKERGVILQ